MNTDTCIACDRAVWNPIKGVGVNGDCVFGVVCPQCRHLLELHAEEIHQCIREIVR